MALLDMLVVATNMYVQYVILWDYLVLRSAHVQLAPDSALFVFDDGSTLTKNLVNSGIKYLVSKLGLNAKDYSSHSLRTESASQGSTSLSGKQLQMLGG